MDITKGNGTNEEQHIALNCSQKSSEGQNVEDHSGGEQKGIDQPENRDDEKHTGEGPRNTGVRQPVGDDMGGDTVVDNAARETEFKNPMINDGFTQSFVSDDIFGVQSQYSSLISVSGINFILNPGTCTICEDPTPQVPSQRWSQRICQACEEELNSDKPLRYLNEIVAKMYAFWIDLRRKEHCDLVDWLIFPGLPSAMGTKKGNPEHKTRLPEVTDVLIHTKRGTNPVVVTLSPDQRQLLEEVILDKMQCHISILIFTKLLEKLVSDPDSPIKDVKEIAFNPKDVPDVICNSHCVHLVTLNDSRRFAVSLTDRQLGWYPLVSSWQRYHFERVEYFLRDIRGEEYIWDLGRNYASNAKRASQDLALPLDEHERNDALQKKRALELADEVIARWEMWCEKTS